LLSSKAKVGKDKVEDNLENSEQISAQLRSTQLKLQDTITLIRVHHFVAQCYYKKR